MKDFKPAGGWGPRSRRGALSITFDNLGEAAELELDLWGDQPVGVHHTATFVPRLVDALSGVRTTYFIEASNTALYPDAIKAWHAAGHEVALHAWRHEIWAACPAERRCALLTRSIAEMRKLGIEPVGFRPPGGAIPLEAWEEFVAAGLLYCSELGAGGIARIGGIISVPFAWRAVDAYMIEDVMGFMRVRHGDPEAPYDLFRWEAELAGILRTIVSDGSHRTVIFHPNFLGLCDKKFDVLRRFVAAAQREDIWIAPVCEVAAAAAAELPALEPAP